MVIPRARPYTCATQWSRRRPEQTEWNGKGQNRQLGPGMPAESQQAAGNRNRPARHATRRGARAREWNVFTTPLDNLNIFN